MAPYQPSCFSATPDWRSGFDLARLGVEVALSKLGKPW
jgi:hypothetical protein